MILKTADWRVKDYSEIQSDGKTIATLTDDLDFPDSYDVSHLMAAAPDLYIALDEAVKNHERASIWLDKAKAALAKAEGEES